MNKEEYMKYVENSEELSRVVETTTTLNTVVEILIKKNVCSKEEFKKIKEENKKQILEESYKREKPEDLETAKTINDFFDLFNIKE